MATAIIWTIIQTESEDYVVRYITLDIINKMNEPEGQTEEFNCLWNDRTEQLQNNFDKIREKLPRSAVAFYEEQVLLGSPAFCRSSNFKNDEYFFVIGKQASQNILFISYDLVYNTEMDIFTGTGFSTTEQAVWLYDEFHQKKDYFEHHIVFSDGQHYIISFKSFYIRATKWFEDE